jgi:hypothetical protein
MRVVSNNDGSDHVFSAISKEEVQPISAFLQSKNVRLKNEMEEAMEVDPISDEDLDDDDDDDVSIPSEDERGRKVKDKGKKPKAAAGDDDDDESGKSDSDSVPASHPLSPSGYKLIMQKMKISRADHQMVDHPVSQTRTTTLVRPRTLRIR